jgi:iron(III) transport system substrate-binding protein
MTNGGGKTLILKFGLIVLMLLFFKQGKADWKSEWEATLQAAKNEGQVNVYARYGGEVKAFQQQYPDIKVVFTTGRGSDLVKRIATERRAEKYTADIYSGGASSSRAYLLPPKALEPIRSAFILPEVLDESKWFEGRYAFGDLENKYIFYFIANVSGNDIFFNSRLVNPREFKSYWDLLDSKWAKKIVSTEPAHLSLGPMLQFFYHHPNLGVKFLRQLFGRKDITFSRDSRQMTDWLAQGQFAICIGCQAEGVKAKAQGLPIESFDTSSWREGQYVTPGGGSLSFINRAPHPNAAKVFINWYLSREGQIAFQSMSDPFNSSNSRRMDIPKEDVPAYRRIVKGRQYLDMSRPEYIDRKSIDDLLKQLQDER